MRNEADDNATKTDSLHLRLLLIEILPLFISNRDGSNGTQKCQKNRPSWHTVVPGYGDAPFIIRGGKMKAVNQYYNKQRAGLQSLLKKTEDRHSSRELDRITASREDFIYNYFHQAAAMVVNYALQKLRKRPLPAVEGRSVAA